MKKAKPQPFSSWFANLFKEIASDVVHLPYTMLEVH